MDIFDSQWLINMLEKSSKTPQGRMLNLFDILGDWLAAPNVQIEISTSAHPNEQLITFLTQQSKLLGASNPSILAEHIVLIARNATLQESNHPNSGSLAHAKKAAHALILAQTQKDVMLLNIIRSKSAVYGIAASLSLLVGAASMWLPELYQSYQPHSAIAASNTSNVANATLVAIQENEEKRNDNVGLSAEEASLMYAKYEQMRNGTCQFPEALQIPDKDKAVYLENVVGGKLPNNLKDLAVANFYLGKVRCNFTPMLMARSN